MERSLGWAQESAERGDYADALGWVYAVEATGEQLPAGYQIKRQAWFGALATPGREPHSTDDRLGIRRESSRCVPQLDFDTEPRVPDVSPANGAPARRRPAQRAC